MTYMLDSDWLKKFLLRSDWLPTEVALITTNFIPNLKARYKMSSFRFSERCLHSTADVDTI